MAHILAEPLISLGRTRARLIQRLTGELAVWLLLAGAWLFGSAARGTGDRESDVDLLLVAEASTQAAHWADGTVQLADHVLSWTGNQAQLVEHTRSVLRAAGAQRQSPYRCRARRGNRAHVA